MVIVPWAVLTRVVEPVSAPDEGVSARDSWQVSRNFTAQQRLIVSIVTGRDWSMLAERTDEYPQDALLVSLVIIDPKGGKTKLEVVYFAMADEGSYLQRSLYFFAADLSSNDGGLAFEESNIVRENTSVYIKKLNGTTNYEGRYEAIINQTESGLPSPPIRLTLSKQQIRIVQPFLLVAPLGGVLIASGAYALIRARRRGERGVRLRNSLINR
jgi:hypothetical protein